MKRLPGAYARNGIVQQTRAPAEKGDCPELLGVHRRLPLRIHEPRALRHRRQARAGAAWTTTPRLALLARTAVSHAEAGADIVAPSDMMDGRVRGHPPGAGPAGFADTPILSYAAKFASAYYGPFREAAESAPQVRRPARLSNGRAPTRSRRCAKWRWTSRKGPTWSWSNRRWLIWNFASGQNGVWLSHGGLCGQRRICDDQGRGGEGLD